MPGGVQPLAVIPEKHSDRPRTLGLHTVGCDSSSSYQRFT